MSIDHQNEPGEDEAAWVDAQRQRVARYLAEQGVAHGEIGDWPAWHVLPYIAVWAVESRVAPGRMGWWAIGGELGTDYVSFADADHPRAALRHFARTWAAVADAMLRGEEHPDARVGSPEQWPELAPLLRCRAGLLRDFADDDALWTDGDH